MRIVSLTCSNTEIVCALGCAHMLVGVDTDSDYPPEVVGPLPKVGRDLNVDAKAVAALRPDLVLASLTVPGHEQVVSRLADEKLDMLVLSPTSTDHVQRDLRWVGRLLGATAQAEALCTELAEVMRPDPRAVDGPRILVEWWPRPVIAAGTKSWVDDMLRAAGAANAVAPLVPDESAPLTDNQILAAEPEAVVISWCGVPFRKYRTDVVYKREAWARLPAIRNRRVYAVPEAWMGRPGPRLIAGVRRLREIADAVRADREAEGRPR